MHSSYRPGSLMTLAPLVALFVAQRVSKKWRSVADSEPLAEPHDDGDTLIESKRLGVLHRLTHSVHPHAPGATSAREHSLVA